VAQQAERSPAVAISNAVVQIYKEGYGKGATRARTRIMDGVIVVELEDVLTRVEHTLVAAGKEDEVRVTRHIFDQANQDSFVKAIEEITGRTVRAFLSQICFLPEIAIVVFLLEPEENGD
jgi:uncharacterized protein YbcI